MRGGTGASWPISGVVSLDATLATVQFQAGATLRAQASLEASREGCTPIREDGKREMLLVFCDFALHVHIFVHFLFVI